MTTKRRLAATAMAVVLGLSLGQALERPAAAATATAGWQSPPAEQFAGASARDQVKRLVVVEAERAGVPPALALALAKVSSDFQPLARSTSGAIGVLQIMPETARLDLGLDPEELKDPRLNIEVGLDRLRRFHDHLGDWALALAAYHAGLDDARRLRQLTSRPFVDTVLEWAERYESQGRLWATLAEREQDWHPARMDVAPPPAASGSAPGRIWPHLRVVSRTHMSALDGDFVDIETRRREAQWRVDDFGPRPDARGPGRSGW
jgi:hypothetical protein